MSNNILLIGGTGTLGNAMQTYNTFVKTNIYATNSKQANTNDVNSNNIILKLIDQHNIDCVVDFARNNKKQLVNALLLLKQLPKDVRYVHISTYGIDHPEIYLNETEYNFVKKTLEEKIRPNDCSIRLPIIVDKYEDIVWNDIATEYVYIATFNRFAQFVFDVILNDMNGKFKLKATKVFKQTYVIQNQL